MTKHSVIRLFGYSVIDKGFTLVELLVVIGIIGILTAALLGAFGGASDSARAVKCMTNMRSLAVAARSVGIPAAGSYEYIPPEQELSEGEDPYLEEKIGWISWLSNRGDPYANHTKGKAKPTTHQTVEICPFYGTGNREDGLYALTNGVLWKYVNASQGIYICPAHQRYRQKKNQPLPLWSYVMNMQYGYDSSKGSDLGSERTWNVKNLKRGSETHYHTICTDRLLLFAEIPMELEGDKWQSDCTLQYKATVDGVKLGDWDGKAESIGFNHKIGKKPPYGHVAFADGHVEKITYDTKTKDGGLTPEQLTALLCEGYDLSFDGTSWKKIPGQD